MSTNMKNEHVIIDINLRARDASMPHRVRMAEGVVEKMTPILEKSFVPEATQDIQLKVTVVTCSEGSRKARFWAAELGRGLAKLNLSWCLVKKSNGEALTQTFDKDLTADGCCGAKDVCDAKYGERVVVSHLSVRAAEEIAFLAKKRLAGV